MIIRDRLSSLASHSDRDILQFRLLTALVISLNFIMMISAIESGEASPSSADQVARLVKQITSVYHLTDSSRAPRITRRDARAYTSRKLNLSPRFCERERVERAKWATAQAGTRIKGYHLETAQRYARACKVNVYTSTREGQDEVIGFSFTNDLDGFINPQRATPHHSERVFTLRFEERVKQNITLRVLDRVGLSERVSEDFMESVIIFLPRLVIPHLRYNCGSCTPRQVAIVLPTGEEAIIDQLSRELRGGVLEEEVIDLNPKPRARHFARIHYHGRGLMIRADRRGGLPERVYPRAINDQEDASHAIITYRGRTCRVPKVKVWSNVYSKRTPPVFRYATDQSFLDQVIEPHCGWRLRVRDLR